MTEGKRIILRLGVPQATQDPNCQLSKTQEGGRPISTRSRLSDSGEWHDVESGGKKTNSNSLHFFFSRHLCYS